MVGTVGRQFGFVDDRTHSWAGGVAIEYVEAGLARRLQPGRVHVKGDVGDLAALQAHCQGGLQHVGHLQDQQATSGLDYAQQCTQQSAAFCGAISIPQGKPAVHGSNLSKGSLSKYSTLRALPSGLYLGQSCSLVNMWTN